MAAGIFAKAYKDVREAVALHKVWFYQAYHDTTAKYKRTFLGSLWVVGAVVTTSLCLAVVFGVMNGLPLKVMLPYVMGGIIAFNLASFMLTDGPEIFMGFAGTIRNHAYPYMYYLFERVAKDIIILGHNLVVFYLMTIVVGAFEIPNWTILLGLPIVIITSITWGTVAGIAASRFRDLRYLLPYISQLMFFVTPVFWHAEDRGERGQIALLNPYYGLLEIVRAPLLGKYPPMICWYLALGTMVAGIIAWLLVFPAFRRRIPFWV